MQLKWDCSKKCYLRQTQIYYYRTYTDLKSNFSKMKQWELMLQKIKLPPSCTNWYFSGKHSWEADSWKNNSYSRTAAAVVVSFSLQNSCDKVGMREKPCLYTQIEELCSLPMFLNGGQYRIECKWTKMIPNYFSLMELLK